MDGTSIPTTLFNKPLKLIRLFLRSEEYSTAQKSSHQATIRRLFC